MNRNDRQWTDAMRNRVNRDNRNWRDNDRRYDNNRRYGYDNRRWDRNWRNDNRYDWRDYRSSNRQIYRLGRYYSPYDNWSYRRLSIGFSLMPLF